METITKKKSHLNSPQKNNSFQTTKKELDKLIENDEDCITVEQLCDIVEKTIIAIYEDDSI